MSETTIVQGELIVQKIVHGAAINTMVVPFDDPQGWYFQQFPTLELLQQFAAEHMLVIKGLENDQNNHGA